MPRSAFRPEASDRSATRTLHLRNGQSRRSLSLCEFRAIQPPPPGTLRQAVLSIDPALPVYDVAMLDDRLADQERPSRVLSGLTATYAVVALFLAAFGLFGVLAHAVRGRTQEIGIRMALGGRPADVMTMVMREGLWLTVAGLASGLVGASLLARTMKALLFGVTPGDPAVYVTIATVLLFVAALACWIPARRAMRVNPIVALRTD